jgi:hypothetical protein
LPLKNGFRVAPGGRYVVIGSISDRTAETAEIIAQPQLQAFACRGGQT